jgi:two-component system, NarL family, nitrate/nitrite response regulator NarL
MSSPSSLPVAALRVVVRSHDKQRREVLADTLSAAGHSTGQSAADADAALIDLAPGETPPEDESLPYVLLSDSPALARDAEVQAVLPRAASARQLDAALRAAVAGLLVRPRDRPAAVGFSPAEDDFPPLLTPRELEILAAIGEGLSNKEVARRLGISAHTVKFHLEAIFAKLHASTRAEAVAKGLRRGLIEA